MTESHRQNLLMACAFAKVFMEAADSEMRGCSPAFRQQAQTELAAALRNLNQAAPVPVVDWRNEVFP